MPHALLAHLRSALPTQRGVFRTAPSALLPIVVSSVALLCGSCGSSDDDPGGSGGSGDVGAPVTTYVGIVRENGIASFQRGNAAFQSDFQIINEAEGGFALDYLGNLYQADPVVLDQIGNPGPGAIRIMNQARLRTFGNGIGTGLGSFNAVFDRSIAGFSTTLSEPRSVALAHSLGLLMVADSGDSTVKVFGASAGGDVPPIFTATTTAAPWDLAYDEAGDDLYVTLTTGTVEVFDGFIAGEVAAPTRTIIPSVDGVAATGIDLRGIALRLAGPGVGLIVSDQGVEDGGSDGAVYVFNDVATADGLTVIDQRLRGAAASLRDPVDVDLSSDGYLRVVDAGNGGLLVFPPQGTLRFESSPSFRSFDTSPFAVSTEPAEPVVDPAPASDQDSPTEPIVELVAATAPAGMNGEVIRLPADLSGPPTAAFDPSFPARGLGLDAMGNVYTSFLRTGGTFDEGGILVLARLGVARGTGADLAFDPSKDRLAEIPGNPFFQVDKPVSPTGIDIDESAGVVLLSDPGRPAIWRFGLSAGVDAIPSVADFLNTSFVEGGFVPGSAEPQQLDFDSATDRLFVAVSNGTIYVYDSFTTQPSDSPDRTITPTDALGASQVSSQLFGLVHDAERDLLIVSDIGVDSGSGNDGSIFLFDGARFASGLTAPIATIAGVSTGLDDPVGLAWDGSTLWVADRANGTVSRFDDLLTLDGDVAPSASLAVPDVVAVSLRPEGLAPTTGGSLGQ